MDKKVLEQLANIKKEIADLKKAQEKVRCDIQRLEKEQVQDTVKGSRNDLTIGPIAVAGNPEREYRKKKMNLIGKGILLKKAEVKLLQIDREAEEYIQSIPDSEIRRIIRYWCVENLTWQQVARKMGRRYTADACRKRYDRFMESG